MNLLENKNESISQRFIRYVKIDTQSDSNSETIPSTEKQKDLQRVLVDELLKMGIKDARLDDLGYVYATIPSTSAKKIPVICFCSHVDTSPDCSGKNVKPIIHYNYNGEDLILPDDENVVIKLENHPDLKAQIGNDIITASGTTLLGADNKAGVAAIMQAAQYFIENPDFEHGEIKILFTPDEEIGRGVDHVDLKKLNADFGYTIDGETLGSIEDETFSADGAILEINGVSAHPGFAKGKMISAIKILSEIIGLLPSNLSPEHTDGKDGFIHPTDISGNVELATAEFILRDFDNTKLQNHAQLLHQIAAQVVKKHPGASFKLSIHEQYRNMKEVLEKYPFVTEYAIKAIERSGLVPKKQFIRGGTDGTRLSFMGLPCPNIFAGEHAFHSKEEWVSIQDMLKSAEVIIRTAGIWAENSGD